MNQLFDLRGKTALVTGSGGGLGFTIARGLAQAGASVVLNGRNQDKLAHATQALTADGLSAWDCAFDVTHEQQVCAGIEQIVQRAGAIDVLVNNAGITRRGALVDLDVTDWDAVISTNLTAPFLVCLLYTSDAADEVSPV